MKAARPGLEVRILEDHPSPTILLDAEFHVLGANRAARSMLGYGSRAAVPLRRSGGEVLRCVEAVGSEGCGRQAACEDCPIRQTVALAAASGSVQRRRATVQLVRPTVGTVQVELMVTVSPMSGTGKPRYILTMEDLAGLVRLEREVTTTEQALRETEARFRTVVDSLAEGVVVSTLEGELFHWNPAALEMHGFRGLEECRRRFSELARVFELSTADGRRLGVDEWPIARILRGAVLRDMELRVRRTDAGWTRVWRYGGRLIRNAEGDPLLAAVTIVDVSDRRRQEDELRDREQQLSLVLEASNDGYWDIHLPDGRFHFSPRCYEILGSTPPPGTPVDRHWWGKLHPDDVRVVHQAIRTHMQGSSDRIDVMARLQSGEGGWRWVRGVGRVVERDGRGRAVRLTGTMRDVTERQEESDRLRDALARVKTLSGLLPICAWCNRVRDDSGYWAKVEAYVSKHSDARFSHGMCPDCYRQQWVDEPQDG